MSSCHLWDVDFLDKVPLALLLGKNPLQLSTELVTVYKENEIIAIFW